MVREDIHNMTTISIHAAVIHDLQKKKHTQGDDSVVLVERQSLHESNALLDKFAEKVDYDSRNASRVTSTCGSFTRENTLSKVIASHYMSNGNQNIEADAFLELSKEMVRALKKQMQDEMMATGGYIPVLWYERDNKDYLVIGLVNPSSGFTLDPTGAIIPNTNIDNASLRFSVSIELTIFNQHLNEDSVVQDDNLDEDNDTTIQISNYVRWTRKKGFVAQYFQSFVPTAIPLNDGATTKEVIKYIGKYLDHIIPETYEGKKKLRYSTEQQIYGLMSQKCRSEETVNVEEDILPIFEALRVSNPELFPQDQDVVTFGDYCENEGYTDYNSIFNPKQSTVDKKLKVDIQVGESISIKGTKRDIDKATSLVVESQQINDKHYKLMIKLTEEEYENIKRNNIGIKIENKVIQDE